MIYNKRLFHLFYTLSFFFPSTNLICDTYIDTTCLSKITIFFVLNLKCYRWTMINIGNHTHTVSKNSYSPSSISHRRTYLKLFMSVMFSMTLALFLSFLCLSRYLGVTYHSNTFSSQTQYIIIHFDAIGRSKTKKKNVILWLIPNLSNPDCCRHFCIINVFT